MAMRDRRRKCACWLAVVLATGTLPWAASARATPAEAPFTWCVEGPRARHVLIGSVHLLPDDAASLPAGMARALADVEVVVFETDLHAIAESGAAAQMLRAARLPQGLAAATDAETLTRVRARAEALDLPAALCLEHRPWFCALSLELQAFRKAGFSGEQGLDRRLDVAARRRGVTIRWLESPDQHLGLFTRMPSAVADAFLQSALADDAMAPVAAARAIVTAWQQDDRSYIEDEIIALKQAYPLLYSHLLAARNREWLPKLRQDLEDIRPHLFVLGAAHWLGPDGLLRSLAAAGYAATPYRADAPACRASTSTPEPAGRAH